MKNTLNIIHDNRRSEKYDPLINELREQKIFSYIIHPATVLKHSVVESINASHKKIVRAAKEAGLPCVIIAEDDVMFTSVGAWQYYLDNMPQSFDLYLGCTYVPPISNNVLCGFHLYTVSKNYYDKFLSVDENKHIDTAVSDMGGNFTFCYPFPCLQRPGFSANNKAIVDYNKILEPKDIYKG